MTQAFKAEVVHGDSRTDVTSDATWTSSDASIATVDSAGVATALTTGTTTIVASVKGVTASATLTVTNAELKEIALSPAKASIASGTTQQYAATGTYTDGTSRDVTNDSGISWASSSSATATVSNKGLATGVKAGSTNISASLHGITGTTSLTITEATLASLAIDPMTSSIAKGTTTDLKVTGTFSDNSTQDLTKVATWSSSDDDVAKVSDSGDSKGTVSGRKAGNATITAAFSGKTASGGVVVTDATLTSIAIMPSSPSVPKGNSQTLTATGTFSDGSTQDLSSTVVWTSSDISIAVVSNAAGSKGRTDALKKGETTITAKRGDISGTVTFKVTDAELVSIEVSASSATLANGTSLQLTATGMYSDGSNADLTGDVTWHSSDTDVVSVDDSEDHKGKAEGQALGTAVISATHGTITGMKSLTVTDAVLSTIAISPLTPTIAKGTKQLFTAIGTFSDGSTQDITSTATWGSSTTAKATISNASGTHGEATGVAAGTTNITAEQAGVTSSSATLTVTDATLVSIAVTPSPATIAKGTTQLFTATGTFSDTSTQNLTTQVNWTSSAAAATISNSTGTKGLASGAAVGSTLIRATLDGIMSPQVTLTVTPATLVSIAVTPAAPSIAKGTNQQFVATGTFTDTSTQDLTSAVTWGSSSTSKATISNVSGSNGRAFGVAAGTTSITAMYNTITSPGITLTVTQEELVSLQITPSGATIADGTDQQFAVTGTYTDGSSQVLTNSVTWNSSDQGVAMIAPGGLATAVDPGTTDITASLTGITSPSVPLTVTTATIMSLAITPATATIAKGNTQQYIANGTFTDSSVQNLTSSVTWFAVGDASISNANGSKGRATGDDSGSATIHASYMGLDSNDATLTITTAALTSITISGPGSLAKGTEDDFTAMGHYSDGTSTDITTAVTWDSSMPSIALISNGTGTEGHAVSFLEGSTSISATDFNTGVTASVTLTVTAAVVTAIQVTPANPQIAQGTKLQFVATGVFSDASLQDLTSASQWNSSATGVATVSNTPGSSGLVTGIAAPGGPNPPPTTISAMYNGIMGSTTIVVTSATLSSIDVQPAAPSRAKGLSAAFTATGLFSDTTTQDLTKQVSWSSSDPTKATISNAVGSEGVASTVAPGTSTISAQLLGQIGSTVLTVTSAEVVSIQLSGTSSAPKGTTAQYTAIGTFTDGTSLDITTSATWSSSDTAVADLCSVQGVSKCFDALDIGPTTITVSIIGVGGSTITATKQLTVTAAVLTSIDVQPAHHSIPNGMTVQYTATGTYSDGTTPDITASVTWSSDSNKASISNIAPQGLATGNAVGGANISATLDGITGTTDLTVTAAVLVSIGVTPIGTSIAKGLHQQYAADGVYSDGSNHDITTSVTWGTDDHLVATISSGIGTEGDLTAVDVGNTNVTATLTSITGSTAVTVTSAVLQTIQVTSAHNSIAKGTTEQYAATGLYSDGSSQPITVQASWTSSATAVATIGLHTGLATSVNVGPTTITASLDGIQGTKNLSVTPEELTTIQVGSAASSIPNGTTLQFTATGVYTDNSQQDLTSYVTWGITGPGVVSVSNALGSKGLVTGTSVGGPTTITATDPNNNTIHGGKSLTITAAIVQSITLSPPTPTIANGTTKQFSVVANYSDNTHPTVTATTTWTSSMTGVALISNNSGSKGLASSVSTGTTTITASFGGQMASTTLTVSNATLVSIAVTPATPSTPLGFTKRFTATGTYTDASTQDLSNQVVWTSSDENVAIISNALGSAGLASTVHTGSSTIRATLGPNFGQTTFTVSSAILQSISVAPPNSSFSACTCDTLVATGTFSDASMSDITSSVTFTTSDATVVSVANNGTVQNPLFQICAEGVTGSVDITATDPNTGVQGVTASTNTIVCP